MEHNHLEISNNLNQIKEVYDFVTEICKLNNFSSKLKNHLNLVLEEVIVNIINYGYKNEQPSVIHINYIIKDNIIEFLVIDNGIPFDPTKFSQPDVTLSVEQRQIGGLGIFLAQNLMDNVTYKREDNKNHLTLSKSL